MKSNLTMIKKAMFTLFVVGTMIGCSKDDDSSITEVTEVDKFFPLTTGSTWEYHNASLGYT
jgi:hypothetical protein